MREDSQIAKFNLEPPAVAPMRRFLESVLPGSSAGMNDLRSRLIAFAINPATNNLLIRGPSGAGKSTVARAVAALKRVAMLTAEEAERVLANLKFEGPNLISTRSLSDWYVELALTGLVESIADVQLFGSVKGAYTGAVEGPGIFEKAARGRMDGAPTKAAELTGGVVFLDEIGDVPEVLQGKLLAILSGGLMYRVGGEGDPDRAVEFNGTVIAATWKPLLPADFRPDLLARVAGAEVNIPGLGERAGDLVEIIRAVERGVIEAIKKRVEHAEITEPMVDRAYWRGWSESLACLADGDVAALAEIDWSRYGHMRGLTAAIREIIVLRDDVPTVIARLPYIGDAAGRAPRQSAEGIYDRLLQRAPDGNGIAAHLRALSLEDASDLRHLLEDRRQRDRLARSLGIPNVKFRTQVLELGRTRRRAVGGRND